VERVESENMQIKNNKVEKNGEQIMKKNLQRCSKKNLERA
jgi:hypothetical protein